MRFNRSRQTALFFAGALSLAACGKIETGSQMGAGQESDWQNSAELGPAISGKPFKHVLVLTGGGLETAKYLGLIQGLEDGGWKPDLIISTCGASVAAALVNAIPNAEERKQHIYSEDFLKKLQTVRVKNRDAAAFLFDLFIRENSSHLPSLFEHYVMDVPKAGLDPFTERPFSAEGTRVIMVAAQMTYGPDRVDAPTAAGGKYYREVFFTDPETAKHIGGARSPIFGAFPESKVMAETATITDATLSEATRASISDEFLMEPMEIKGTYYLTGGVDLYPIELAHFLGEEVIMPYTEDWDAIEGRAVKITFGFDPNERQLQAYRVGVDHWIDLTDESDVDDEYGFEPGQSVSVASSAVNKGGFGWLIENKIPVDHETYVKKLDGQWSYGLKRGSESLTHGSDTSWIRSHPKL